MSVDEIVSPYIPDYVDLVADVMAFCGGVFVAGVLAAFIAWAIGFAVHSVYRWLNDSGEVNGGF